MANDVSVIIPAYRAAATIGRALASVAGQTLRPREVIVVDDGSGDGTMAAAEAMREHMNGIALIVVAQQNRGAGAARNRAIGLAGSRYLAFLDADDEWLPGKIERSMAVLADADHTLVAHDYIRVDADGTERLIECARRFDQAANPFTGLFRQGFIGTSMVIARRDAVLAAGGFDESLATAQDFDLWLKMLAGSGVTFTIFPEALTRYHVTGGSITSFTARRLACSLRIARRHAPGPVDLWYRICAIHYEAVMAYRSGGRVLKALQSAARLPLDLLAATIGPGRPPPPPPRWLVAALWLWVVGGFGAYLYRFRDLVVAALKMVLPS